MASLFHRESTNHAEVEALIRELATTRSRCRHLEDLLGVTPDDVLPTRNEVIARAERDAALIRVTAQRFADQLLDEAQARVRRLHASVHQHQVPPPPQASEVRVGAVAPVLTEPWPGRQRVAHLWGVDAEELDANIDRFMATEAHQ